MSTTHPTHDIETKTDARELLVDLVSTPSPSGEEAEAAQVLVAFFEEHDREVFVDEAGNVRAPADDSVLLTSHIDTVPGNIPVEVKEGSLWGRGSVDATGPLAAMAAASVETGVSFAGVVEEETTSAGARFLCADRDEPDAVINGEPSGVDGITLGYRGFLDGTYVSTSESGHSSRPDMNAIEKAMEWWQDVENAFEADEWRPIFEQVTTKPVGFDGGLGADGLSVEATMDVQFRIPPALSAEELRELADSKLVEGTVHWNDPIPPVMESSRTEVARAFRVAIRTVNGRPRMLRKTGTSDMNLYADAWSCPMVTYGPGNSDLDHAPNEHLSLEEFDDSVQVLTEVCETLTE